MQALLLLCALAVGGEETRRGSKTPAPQPTLPKIVVRCLDQALVRGVDVRLRDVAEVQCDDPDLAARVLDVSFGRRPARGFNRELPQSAIRAQLAAEGVLPSQLELTGAQQVVVQALSTLVQPQELIDVAEPIVRAAIDLEPVKDIEFELVAKPQMIEVPPGRRSFDLRGRVRGNKLQSGSAMIEVAVVVDGEDYKVVQLPYRLRRFGTAVVVLEPTRRETPLGPEFLEERRIELTHGAETMHVGSLHAVRGRVAARDLKRGQVLRISDMAMPAVIRAGDPIALVLRRGQTLIKTNGIARNSGAIGDRIDVLTKQGRTVRGVAERAGVVVVLTAGGE